MKLHINTKLFSRWAHWNNRDELEGLQFPGVYALAISKHDLSGKRFSWIEQIVYVGMSNAVSGLRGRLKQFDNTIIGKTGHGGAERFLHDFPSHEKLVPLLYVVVAPFKCKVTSNAPSDLLVMGDVAKAEYECWAQFVTIFKRLPKYNDKKKAPKFSKSP
jgi:hypothetical protein